MKQARPPRTARGPVLVCRLDAAAVTVDYRTGRVTASLDTPTDKGAMVPGPRWRPSWGSRELEYGYREPPWPTNPPIVSSAVGLLIALVVLRIGRRGRGLGRLLRFLDHVRLLPGSDAAPDIARTQCLVVRRLGILVPLRVACLEESAAAMIALALRGHRVVWRHGIAADPVEFHAWLTTPAGDAIAEPASTERFRALVTIPRTNTDLEPGEEKT